MLDLHAAAVDFPVHTQSLTVEQSLASLHTSAAGLTSVEALRRLAEFGPNHVEEVAREHLLLRFAREFNHFFAIILWVGAALAFLAESFDPGQGMVRFGNRHCWRHSHQRRFLLLAGI